MDSEKPKLKRISPNLLPLGAPIVRSKSAENLPKVVNEDPVQEPPTPTFGPRLHSPSSIPEEIILDDLPKPSVLVDDADVVSYPMLRPQALHQQLSIMTNPPISFRVVRHRPLTAIDVEAINRIREQRAEGPLDAVDQSIESMVIRPGGTAWTIKNKRGN